MQLSPRWAHAREALMNWTASFSCEFPFSQDVLRGAVLFTCPWVIFHFLPELKVNKTSPHAVFLTWISQMLAGWINMTSSSLWVSQSQVVCDSKGRQTKKLLTSDSQKKCLTLHWLFFPFPLLKLIFAKLLTATSAQFRLSCLVSLPCLIRDLVVLGLCSEIGIWMWSVPNQGSRGGAPSCPFQTVPPTEDQVFDHMGGHSHSNHHIILPGNSRKQEETSFQILLFFGCTSIFVAAT